MNYKEIFKKGNKIMFGDYLIKYGTNIGSMIELRFLISRNFCFADQKINNIDFHDHMQNCKLS